MAVSGCVATALMTDLSFNPNSPTRICENRHPRGAPVSDFAEDVVSEVTTYLTGCACGRRCDP